MTEQQEGGNAPEPEALASAADEAPDTAVAVIDADEPANTADGPAAAANVPEVETVPEGEGIAAAAQPIDVASPAAEDESTASAYEPALADGSAAADGASVSEQPAVAPEVTSAGPEAAASDRDADGMTGVAESPSPIKQPSAALGPEPETMEELLAEQDSEIKTFKHGDVVEGNVVRIDKDEILVDIGAKSEGVVSNRELFGRNTESQPQLVIGDTVLVYVLQPESPEGHVVLSLRRAGLERKWRAMQEQFESGMIIEAPVIDHNKGGLIVDCGIRGFVPISQIVDFPRRPQNDQPRDAAQEIAEKLQPFVGRKLRLKILEVNRKANRLILSEKVALYEERREKRDELFSSLQVGQKVKGTVRSIAPFGVFIDLGGIDGLVHKSELSWNKVNNPEAGYKVGDEVEAEVIDINHERGRISLSIRRLQPDPWHSTVADFNVGDIIDGTVTKLVNFGAFVRVRDGLEGLIHISELSHQRVVHPGDVVHEGQTLKLKIISLDSERHRLGLSLKQADEAPPRPAAPEPTQERPAGPRAERRPRQERGYSMTDAVQEPEGGIDNTLASAFAQVRQQLAEAEGEPGVEEEVEPAAEVVPAVEAEPAAEVQIEPAAEVEIQPTEAEAEPAAEVEIQPTEAEAEPAAEVEIEPTEAEVEPAAEVEVEPPKEQEPATDAEPSAEAQTAAEGEPAVEVTPRATLDEAMPEPEAVEVVAPEAGPAPEDGSEPIDGPEAVAAVPTGKKGSSSAKRAAAQADAAAADVAADHDAAVSDGDAPASEASNQPEA